MLYVIQRTTANSLAYQIASNALNDCIQLFFKRKFQSVLDATGRNEYTSVTYLCTYSTDTGMPLHQHDSSLHLELMTAFIHSIKYKGTLLWSNKRQCLEIGQKVGYDELMTMRKNLMDRNFQTHIKEVRSPVLRVRGRQVLIFFRLCIWTFLFYLSIQRLGDVVFNLNGTHVVYVLFFFKKGFRVNWVY